MRTKTMLQNATTQAEIGAAVAVARARGWTDALITKHLGIKPTAKAGSTTAKPTVPTVAKPTVPTVAKPLTEPKGTVAYGEPVSIGATLDGTAAIATVTPQQNTRTVKGEAKVGPTRYVIRVGGMETQPESQAKLNKLMSTDKPLRVWFDGHMHLLKLGS